MIMSEDRIIFISGCAHSGTTLLSIILDSHSQIYAIKRETNWFNNFQYTDPIIKHEFEFERDKPHGKKILVEKTANHIFNIPKINKSFPNCRHLFIVRNALDTCASLYRRNEDLDWSIDRWNQANEFLLTHVAESNAYLIKYDNLVNDAASEMQEVCEFLGLTYEREMLEYYKRDVYLDGDDSVTVLRNKQIKHPIYNTVGSHKNILNESQCDYVVSKTKRISKIFY